MTQLYRIEELFTNGWELIDEDSTKLTKDQCNEKIRYLLEQGYNPKYLRAVSDV